VTTMSYERRPTGTDQYERVDWDDGTGVTKTIGIIVAVLLIASLVWILFGTGVTPEGTGGGQGEAPSPVNAPIERPAVPGTY